MKFSEFIKLNEAQPMSKFAKDFDKKIEKSEQDDLTDLADELNSLFKAKKVSAAEFDELSANIERKLNEAQIANIDSDIASNLSYKIPALLNVANQIHLFHWMSTEHKVHAALDELYDTIRDIADDMAEAFVGMGGKIQDLTGQPDAAATGDISTIRDYLETQLDIVNTCIENTNTAELMTINNLAVDLQSALQKTLYLIR